MKPGAPSGAEGGKRPVRLILCGESREELEEAAGTIARCAAERDVRLDITVVPDWRGALAAVEKFRVICIGEDVWREAWPAFQKALMDGRGRPTKPGGPFVLFSMERPLREPSVRELLEAVRRARKPLLLPAGGGSLAVPPEDLIYFETAGRKLAARTRDGRFPVRLTMAGARELTRGLGFASPYVSFLVNLTWVAGARGRDVLLRNGEKLPLSQKRAARFRKTLRDFSERFGESVSFAPISVSSAKGVAPESAPR